ncbi:proline/glycine betaine ABC transporter permease [Sanguibacter sp. HDW7]|uniref:ABC transporter permease n=1 Tax=Sanguibacter sp. HDW7 TaxID=2714931 RepID=UPI00140EBEF4|nr:proline/glycine betaine ABC transporter permease [Sanguibacter sp. HDW7]QIK84623.1 proline/glycine betaine ABC transporter permease [Sanguibacter sp. HDW7]
MSDTLMPRLPLGDVVADAVDVITKSGKDVFDSIKTGFLAVYDVLELALTSPPAWGVILLVAALAWWVKGWRLSLGSAAGLVLVAAVDQWHNAMATLALVLLASVVAIVLAVPLGIWAARSDRVSAVLRPVLDLMQTMPAFVYLIPTVVVFLTGVVPGLVATIIFALAPGVRFTELGIRQVDPEVVEAGHAFGATEGRILRQIQLPLALPTIMAGVNQVIMLSLSMVVIAGLTGAPGLGRDVVAALQRINVSLGVEAGLSVVILAMILDRITAALADRAPVARALARG